VSIANPQGRTSGTDGILRYRWIAGKISEILGNEDDVVIELCFNLIEGARFVSLLVGAQDLYGANSQHSRISRRCKSNSPGFSIKIQLGSARNCGSSA
jgi:hypothetical protein